MRKAPAVRPAGRLLPRVFFERSPEQVAPLLLGKLLVRKFAGARAPAKLPAGGIVAGRIVEVEAYLGPHSDPPDPAAHSHRGLTPRNAVLFGPAGHAYVYGIYGMHFCMNISCEPEGRAGCVLLRALEPVAGIVEMARNRGIDLKPCARPNAGYGDPRVETGHGLHILTDFGGATDTRDLRNLTGGPGRLCQALGITRATDNGIDLLDASSPLQIWDDGFAVTEYIATPRIGITHAAERPLRFVLPGSGCISGPKSLTGRRIRK